MKFIDGITEMNDMFKYDTDIPERRRIIEKYGRGFDEIYFDGKYDGIIESKLESARNFLAKGVDEEIISECINLSIEEIKEIKRKL